MTLIKHGHTQLWAQEFRGPFGLDHPVIRNLVFQCEWGSMTVIVTLYEAVSCRDNKTAVVISSTRIWSASSFCIGTLELTNEDLALPDVTGLRGLVEFSDRAVLYALIKGYATEFDYDLDDDLLDRNQSMGLGMKFSEQVRGVFSTARAARHDIFNHGKDNENE